MVFYSIITVTQPLSLLVVFIKWSKASFCSSDQFYKQKFRNSISFSLSRPALLCLVVIEISNTKKLACTSSNLNFRIPWGKCKLHVVVSLLKIPLCGLHYFQCDVWVTTTKCPRSIYYDFSPPCSFKCDFGRDPILSLFQKTLSEVDDWKQLSWMAPCCTS